MKSKTNIFGLTLSDLQKFCLDKQLPKFVSKQICEWLYAKNANNFAQMSNISLKIRELLSENFEILKAMPVENQTSSDGTIKYLFANLNVGTHLTDDFVTKTDTKNAKYETVYMPATDRHTLCISSQIGCRMACSFCATGKMGFKGNLTTAEILSQLVSIPERGKITNFVFMGMGEPMDNLNEVLKTLEILTSDWGYKFSPRRITVSTIGIIPEMERFINESECHLAVSMHSPFDFERQKLMPIQKKHPITDVVAVLKKYDWSHQRRLSFEYILFPEINDNYRHIDEIAKLLKGLFCRVNVIKFHPNNERDFKEATQENLDDFRDKLNDRGIIATVRKSRGEDIMASCGLLAGKID
ncbi:MAG: 23S rRNA (adenine(2503)-C(2))-methyltransferase RlmN [Bacteroidales bacterium]|jgi:23S rRNA (adenine2503-C2)-methyltransferase|nr:23S rRNA (adenine(2503)-C(2))-methyltransferase RlmN [Bacteroidales bacterium]